MNVLSDSLKTLLAALVLMMAVPPILAADYGSPAAPTDSLTTARSLIAEKKWQDAIGELTRVGEARSADWNNLMGYSLRKARTPDLAAAEGYYSEALRINPKHRGALEYSGELYLMMGDLAKA